MKETLFDRLAKKWMNTPIAKRMVSGNIKRILSILYPLQSPEEVCKSYYHKKMVLMLQIGTVIAVLTILVMVSEYSSSLKRTGNVLLRGEDSQQITLEVQMDGSDKTSVVYELNPKCYTPEKIREYVDQFRSQGETLILGENEDFMHVHTNLCLKEFYEDYPMQFSWESSDYGRIAQDGSVENENLKSAQTVLLTAEMRYEEQVYKQEYVVCVVPKVLTKSMRQKEAILSVLRQADEDQKFAQQFRLPEKILGENVRYEFPQDYTPALMFAVLPVILVIVYKAKDRDLEKELERRKQRLSYGYPEFVSKVQLLLGAGISLRNVLIRLSEDSSLGEELQGEMQIIVRDLRNGILLRDALDRFGKRTANPLYIKFSALMIQNMKKGTEDLLLQLSGEASEAFSLRKIQARQLGEEAGTKLLLPMVMMLAVVMATLMIPAFMSFQL